MAEIIQILQDKFFFIFYGQLENRMNLRQNLKRPKRKIRLESETPLKSTFQPSLRLFVMAYFVYEL